MDLVALAQLEGSAHGFRHRGLVSVGQRGLDFEGGSHVAFSFWSGIGPNGNAEALYWQCICIASVDA
jgi:hypothetical protein